MQGKRPRRWWNPTAGNTSRSFQLATECPTPENQIIKIPVLKINGNIWSGKPCTAPALWKTSPWPGLPACLPPELPQAYISMLQKKVQNWLHLWTLCRRLCTSLEATSNSLKLHKLICHGWSPSKNGFQPGCASQELLNLPLCSKVLPILLEDSPHPKLVSTLHHSYLTSTLQVKSLV